MSTFTNRFPTEPHVLRMVVRCWKWLAALCTSITVSKSDTIQPPARASLQQIMTVYRSFTHVLNEKSRYNEINLWTC